MVHRQKIWLVKLCDQDNQESLGNVILSQTKMLESNDDLQTQNIDDDDNNDNNDNDDNDDNDDDNNEDENNDRSDEIKTSQTKEHPKFSDSQENNEDSQKDRQNCSNGATKNVDQIDVVTSGVITSKVKMSSIIYLSRGLSAWGDRLWAFGIGIFMNLMGPKNLRLLRRVLLKVMDGIRSSVFQT